MRSTTNSSLGQQYDLQNHFQKALPNAMLQYQDQRRKASIFLNARRISAAQKQMDSSKLLKRKLAKRNLMLAEKKNQKLLEDQADEQNDLIRTVSANPDGVFDFKF